MRVAKYIIGLAVVAMAQFALAQVQVGENTKLNAGGLFSFGYAGDYSNEFPSNHGLNWGLDGKLSGSYYSPNFLSFTATPYYNQSRADSSYQSLTGSSGVSGTANFFTGSNFPGSVTYRYDANSTGTFGLAGQPDFTTHGKGQGFGIGWSALLPGLPTLSVGYSQGSGSGTIFGTDQQTSSSNKTFNLRSNYQIEGFRLNGFYDHTSFDSKFPEFLAGQQEAVSNTGGHDYGVGATHSLPFHGSFYANYSRSSAQSDYFSDLGQTANTSSYSDSTENVGATFHPTDKLSLRLPQPESDQRRNSSTRHQSRLRFALHHARWRRVLSVHEVSVGPGPGNALQPVLLWPQLHRLLLHWHRQLFQEASQPVQLLFLGDRELQRTGLECARLYRKRELFPPLRAMADLGKLQLCPERPNDSGDLYDFLL
jgi:hypothetical protein